LKYRLQGVDSDWQEVQRERRAHYTNLAPGRYRFQVIAANEDGVWNQHGATLQFEIKPALWQTNWFRVLLALLLVLLMAALYRWRMLTVRRRAEDRAAALIEATLQERSRIARSLHDNLLQAVQALLLRFHTLQGRVQQEPDLQERLNQVLLHAEQLVESTRDEVVALRSDTLRDDLFVALRKAVAATLPAAERLLAFSIAGVARPLREEVAGELYYVLREAVWNSARHAQASRIGVELRFGAAALEASVADDGVGLRDDCPLAADGHWGITGMRERVQRIGGAIEIGAGATGGVTVRVTIPAALAYAPAQA
jgi:signal transduction histidine kinase